MIDDVAVLKRRIRLLLVFFIVCLVLSGVTAFPLCTELGLLNRMAGEGSTIGRSLPGLGTWISRVHHGVAEMDRLYPFMAYGTDWLAFAHIVIGIAFIGPLRDPVKNVWVVEFGMIACVLVIPLALICGQIRGIPLLWRLIDCSFGVIGIMPLWLVRRYIRRIVQIESHTE